MKHFIFTTIITLSLLLATMTANAATSYNMDEDSNALFVRYDLGWGDSYTKIFDFDSDLVTVGRKRGYSGFGGTVPYNSTTKLKVRFIKLCQKYSTDKPACPK